MTFRPETSPKDSNSNKQDSTDGGKQNQPATKISTIYDPRLQCTQRALVAETKIPVYAAHKTNPLYSPKKSLIEKIKKISFKLYSSKSSDGIDLDEAQKRMRLIKWLCLSVLLACKIVVMLSIFVFMFRTVQKPEIRNIIVDGEFQILNRKFEFDMLDKESPSFKELAFNLTHELNRLFRRSDVGECYQRSEILEMTPNMTIKSLIVFHNCENMNVGRIGLAFLRSLRLQHGHTFLGLHTINVQSIGFQIRGEEGIWGEWSDWKGCESPTDYVATRTRHCLTRDTFQVTNVDRCLLIPGNISDLDIIPCKKYRALMRQKEIDDFARAIFNNINEREQFPIPITLEEDIETGPL